MAIVVCVEIFVGTLYQNASVDLQTISRSATGMLLIVGFIVKTKSQWNLSDHGKVYMYFLYSKTNSSVTVNINGIQCLLFQLCS